MSLWVYEEWHLLKGKYGTNPVPIGTIDLSPAVHCWGNESGIAQESCKDG